MVRHVGGSRRKTRSKFRKNVRQRGKVSLVRYFQRFKEGDKIQLNAEPSIHSGFYHQRFHGRTGVVKAKRGRCYEVLVNDRNKEKMLIVHPVHITRLQTKAPSGKVALRQKLDNKDNTNGGYGKGTS